MDSPPPLIADSDFKNGLISDEFFFRSITQGKGELHAVDHTDYEGADIICDLNKPIPAHLYAQFDFIYNGSVLDNVFNPAMALVNMSRMLRPGGRIIHLEHGTRVNGPYLTFPPDWFLDYYAANNYTDCKAYTASFGQPTEWNSRLHFEEFASYIFDKNGGIRLAVNNLKSLGEFFTVVVAEKGLGSTDDEMPSQSQYRSRESHFKYAKKHAAWLKQNRHLFKSKA
jgi:SAM-dependent methyltransferase